MLLLLQPSVLQGARRGFVCVCRDWPAAVSQCAPKHLAALILSTLLLLPCVLRVLCPDTTPGAAWWPHPC